MNEINLSFPQFGPGGFLGARGAGALERLAHAGARGDVKAIEQAAKDFESILLQQLLEGMRSTVPDSGLLDDDTGKQYESMFWDFLAQDVADKGGLGLWKDLYEQWSRQAGLSADEGASMELLR